ncbi:MAG: hypothetical protein NT076_01205 [Candidatus Pacearchaeota archaeon]|nr:hypothetical protein [Candidatus Pacearchaeota archaeon]
MRNKKAWLRIVEAFVAVALIASVLVVLYVRNQPSRSSDVCKLEETILEEIASDAILRSSILSINNMEIGDFVNSRTPDGFNSTTRICNVTDICGLQFYKQNICARERVISSNLTAYQPVKIKIFMWQEK